MFWSCLWRGLAGLGMHVTALLADPGARSTTPAPNRSNQTETNTRGRSQARTELLLQRLARQESVQMKQSRSFQKQFVSVVTQSQIFRLPPDRQPSKWVIECNTLGTVLFALHGKQTPLESATPRRFAASRVSGRDPSTHCRLRACRARKPHRGRPGRTPRAMAWPQIRALSQHRRVSTVIAGLDKAS